MTITVVDLGSLFDDVLGPAPLVQASVIDLGPVTGPGTEGAPVVWSSATTTPVSTDADARASTFLDVGDRRWRLDVPPRPPARPG